MQAILTYLISENIDTQKTYSMTSERRLLCNYEGDKECDSNGDGSELEMKDWFNGNFD